MAATSETRSWDALVTSTLSAQAGEIKDNIYKAFPVLAYMKEAKRVLSLDGGDRIKSDLMYGKNTTVKSMSGYELLDTTPQDGITAAFFDWKLVSATLVMSYFERRKNSGKNQLFNLLEAKKTQTILAVKEDVTRQMLSDGTGNGGLDITGLALAVKDTPTTGTYGAIDPSTETWWRNQYNASVGSFKGNDGLGAVRKLYRLASRGQAKGSPDVIITEGDIYDSFEAEHVLRIQFVPTGKMNESMANLGISNFKYKNAVVMEEEQMDSAGRIYLLNTEYLKFAIDKETDFKFLPAVTPSNQAATVAPMLVMCNLIMTNRAKQAVGSGASA